MKRVFSLMLALFLLLPVVAVSAKSNEQIAQELIFGKWAIKNTNTIVYEFNENNIRILNASQVDPMGESRINVNLKNMTTGSWINFKVMLVIDLNNDKYEMLIVKRRDNGIVVNDGDATRTYVKVY